MKSRMKARTIIKIIERDKKSQENKIKQVKGSVGELKNNRLQLGPKDYNITGIFR